MFEQLQFTHGTAPCPGLGHSSRSGVVGVAAGAPAPSPPGGCASALGAEAPGISLTRWDRPL